MPQWITDAAFASRMPRNVFHRQLEPLDLPADPLANAHILFRRRFSLTALPEKAVLRITADDYYKLYINGAFVGQGPAPGYPTSYRYNEIDVLPYLCAGENVIAVHTYYQGLINRVWVSGDYRHGLWCDLTCDGQRILESDGSFLVHRHTGYTAVGKAGYDTQFLETYDSRAAEVGFAAPDFDDSEWSPAALREHADYVLLAQETRMLAFEQIDPVVCTTRGNVVFVDFGSTYVGYLTAAAVGRSGDVVEIRCGQELNEDGTVRHALRANCDYVESWILSGGRDRLDWFDFKSFRYAELVLPAGAEVTDIHLLARHYPFRLTAKLSPAYEGDPELRRIWELCVHTLRYGVQEVIQDCMEREKGFYVGDGCYTAYAHMLLTGDDTIVRKLIDDAFRSTFITPGMVTCLDCAMMQEIAEYPLMLLSLMLWHAQYTGDLAYLASHYDAACALLDVYRRDYERNGLLSHLDKWCVVEWPKNFQDGYAIDIREGKVCEPAHVSLNAYYIEAIRCANAMAALLGRSPYRDAGPLIDAFYAAFYMPETHTFRDGVGTDHSSYIANTMAYAYDLIPDESFRANYLALFDRRGAAELSLFCTFPILWHFRRSGDESRIRASLKNPGAWLRMLSEGATTTYEGWGRDTKWNTSLFHLTMAYAAIFLCD